MSATDEVRLKRGSTWMIFAPFSCALRIHFIAITWFSAALLTLDEEDLGVLEIRPVVRHRATAERWPPDWGPWGCVKAWPDARRRLVPKSRPILFQR